MMHKSETAGHIKGDLRINSVVPRVMRETLARVSANEQGWYEVFRELEQKFAARPSEKSYSYGSFCRDALTYLASDLGMREGIRPALLKDLVAHLYDEKVEELYRILEPELQTLKERFSSFGLEAGDETLPDALERLDALIISSQSLPRNLRPAILGERLSEVSFDAALLWEALGGKPIELDLIETKVGGLGEFFTKQRLTQYVLVLGRVSDADLNTLDYGGKVPAVGDLTRRAFDNAKAEYYELPHYQLAFDCPLGWILYRKAGGGIFVPIGAASGAILAEDLFVIGQLQACHQVTEGHWTKNKLQKKFKATRKKFMREHIEVDGQLVNLHWPQVMTRLGEVLAEALRVPKIGILPAAENPLVQQPGHLEREKGERWYDGIAKLRNYRLNTVPVHEQNSVGRGRDKISMYVKDI